MASTLSTPSTARRAITVASHFAKTNCCDCFPKHGLAASSGVGPVVREAAANPKPTISAPGVQVTSAKADAANLRGNCCSCCPDLCCCLYEPLNGTSMAAPHVSGAVALMFQANPNLTRDDIDRHLRASARPRPAGNLNTPEAWGAGYLNVDAAVQAVVAALPPGGGGGGGQPLFSDDGPLAPVRWSDGDVTGGAAFDPVQLMRERIDALGNGPVIAALVSRHFSEVRRIINTNRRVAALWHRSDGPQMLRRVLHGVADAGAPGAIQSEAQERYVHRWCDLLVRYGSARLRQEVERHRAAILDILRTPIAAQAAAQTARP
jgi:hypothetical protein